MLYNAVVVSAIHQCEPVIYIYIPVLLSLLRSAPIPPLQVITQWLSSSFVRWDYCANQATNEPAYPVTQSDSLSLVFFFLTPSMHCQAHSVKCFQIRVLPCSCSDSLVSTLPSSRNSSWKVFVAIMKRFFSFLLPLAGIQVLGYGFGSLCVYTKHTDSQTL